MSFPKTTESRIAVAPNSTIEMKQSSGQNTTRRYISINGTSTVFITHCVEEITTRVFLKCRQGKEV
ncbi:hypothetical protein BOTNAR_0505g00030 [Botryotinia narcissicola]|uniref:Uncharacterized protein n=1 Tax=Botryotinia narcissicola TaxID=278944 RepID=A0A4Z1HFJ3_9HELO|nr:hypothetical protein BOTNAR_0505g00030 [Botryotinia narcissicola]